MKNLIYKVLFVLGIALAVFLVYRYANLFHWFDSSAPGNDSATSSKDVVFRFPSDVVFGDDAAIVTSKRYDITEKDGAHKELLTVTYTTQLSKDALYAKYTAFAKSQRMYEVSNINGTSTASLVYKTNDQAGTYLVDIKPKDTQTMQVLVNVNRKI